MVDMREDADHRDRAAALLPLAHDTTRTKLNPRGDRGAVPKRRTRMAAGDRMLVAAMIAAFGASLIPALLPSPYRAEAPIRIAEVDLVPPPAPVETAALRAPSALPAIDPAATGSLGGVRGTVSDTPAEPNAPKIIEVPREATRDFGPIRISDPSDMRQPLKVAHLPDRALLDEEGRPQSANGRRPLDVYAGQWSGRRGNRIAIVVGGLGLSQSGTQEAIEKLPAGVTLGISPDGNSLERWARAARRDGHELLLQVPMQAFGRGEPDPRERRLELDLPAGENVRRLRRSMERITNYVGVMNYRGGAFQAREDAISPIVAEVRDRGLLYLDDGSNAQSRVGTVARGLAAPYASADTVLDLDRDAEAVRDELAKLEETARGTGRAIAVATAYPETVDAIAEWAKDVTARGFELVPVSALADDPGRR